MIKKKHLCGVEVPDWYFERERELLEACAQLAEAKRIYAAARNKMVGKMSAEGIERIDSDLCSVTLYDSYVDGKRRRRLQVRLGVLS